MKKINKSGISLMVLLVSIIVIIILTTTVTLSAEEIITDVRKKQFAREIYEIQNVVDKYKFEYEDYPYIVNEGNRVQIEVSIEGYADQFSGEDIIDNKVNLYPINLSKAGIETLSRGTKKDLDQLDVYAFSSKTGKVYYVKGYTLYDKVYFTLTDELKKSIGIFKNELNDSKVIREESI